MIPLAAPQDPEDIPREWYVVPLVGLPPPPRRLLEEITPAPIPEGTPDVGNVGGPPQAWEAGTGRPILRRGN